MYKAAEPFKSHSHQIFARNFINPSTPYKRLLAKHDPGTGKTALAAVIATEFINVYKRQAEQTKSANTPHIMVLGFTHDNFKNELVKFPDFGFASQVEIDKLERLRLLADKGIPGDIKHYRDYDSMLKRRITSARSRTTLTTDVNTSSYGYYKFYGYQALVNRIFIPLEDDVDVTSMISKFRTDYEEFIEDVQKAVDDKHILVNWELVNSFKNSLVICDEIHNTYNSVSRNNWGTTIQFILNHHDDNIRALFLSATPINNSPTEIVDILSLLLPRGEILKKRDLFINDRTLQPDAKDKIRKAIEGRVSFLQDSNLKYYPETIMHGEPIKYTDQINTDERMFPYFKFIRCPMSKFHHNTYERWRNKETDITDNDDENKVKHDIYSLRDIAFPNPEFTLEQMKSGNIAYGLFHSGKIKETINNAGQKWKSSVGVEITGKQLWTLEGSFQERENLKIYSAKFAEMLKLLDNIFKKPGKCFIYHHRVTLSGILQVAAILKRNGIIDEFSTPAKNTLCSICAKPMSDHKGSQRAEYNIADGSPNPKAEHKYLPMRFILIHGAIDLGSRRLSLSKFNSSDNTFGTNHRILLGSQVLMESFDIKSVVNMVVLSIPDNIPDMIQLYGRVSRKNSHALLPPEYRKVNYYNLVTSTNNSDVLSMEEMIYGNKLLDYLVIQELEQILHEYAVDAYIHRDITMSKDLVRKYFGTDTEGLNSNGSSDPNKVFGNLYFKPKPALDSKDLPVRLEDMQLSTFTAYHNDDEIANIKRIIIRLFVEHRAMTHETLWKLVQSPPFSVEVSPKLFTEENFIVALDDILSTGKDITYDTFKQNIITHNGREFQIVSIGEYLAMVSSEDGVPKIDAEMFSLSESKVGKEIDISDLISSFDSNKMQLLELNNQVKKCKSIVGMLPVLYSFNAQFHYELMEKIISGEVKKSSLAIYTCLMDLYNKFEILLYPKHIPKSEPTLYAMFKNKSMKLPIGYTNKTHGVVYNGSWINIEKAKLNITSVTKENNCIIGFFDNLSNFKVRRPTHKISADGQKDIRMIEHGMVCQTKHKDEIVEIVKKMGMKIDKSKIKHICDELLHKLLLNEIAERKKSPAARIKWFYMFNEEQHVLKKIRGGNADGGNADGGNISES
jgi:hypothetical protein